MIHIYTPLMLLLILAGNLFGQTPTEPEKKVYKSENEKLYINKDLGIYLWISTSPEPDSEKIRLKSESTGKYSNPMYLDTEGYNTVRSLSAVDTVTRKTVYPLQDVIFEVYADGVPPVTRSKYSYQSTYMLSGKRFYSGDVKIELKAQDEVSGTENIFYSLNSNDFKAYSKVLSHAKEGENILKFYSTDHVGNASEIKQEIFFLDNTPPGTSYKILGQQNEKFVSAEAKIKPESKDVVLEFYIGREPPEVSLEIDSTDKSYKANYTYVSPLTKLITTANTCRQFQPGWMMIQPSLLPR